MKKNNLLLVASSEHDPDMLYATGLLAARPLVYLLLKSRPQLLAEDLEFERARREARHCTVRPLSHYRESLRRQGLPEPSAALVLQAFLKEKRVKRVDVPEHFPHGLARQLRDLKVKVRLRDGECFPERAFKSGDELKKISAALTMAEVGLDEGVQALKRAKAGGDGRLLLNHLPLTRDRLRAIIDSALVRAGGMPGRTVVAVGPNWDPREIEAGPLRAGQPIVLRVFPRSERTGYYAGLTRTVAKGRASEAARRMYHTVHRAQEIAFAKVSHEASSQEVHAAVTEFFAQEGYRNGNNAGRRTGSCDELGHGVGLSACEAPRIGRHSSDRLSRGHVLAVGPGLYYPEVGGIRLEDLGHIAGKRFRNLTQYERRLEI